MTTLDDRGVAVRGTDFHQYPLPPDRSRFTPTFDSYGRYVLPHPNTGRATNYSRVSVVSKSLDDTTGLDLWKRRLTVRGLHENRNLLPDLDSAFTDRAAGNLAEQAFKLAGGVEAAEFGTAVHDWLHAIDAGHTLPALAPPMFRAHGHAYLNALGRTAITALPQYCERIVLYRNGTGESVVGTLDRIYSMADGSLVLGDLKTSKSLEYSYLSFAAQLAAYRDAHLMLSEDGTEWLPMPDLVSDYALLVHCPSNAPEATAAIPFSLNVGRKVLGLAFAIRELRSTAKTLVPNAATLPIPDTVTSSRHRVIAAIRNITEPVELQQIWEDNKDIWTDELTALGNAVAQQLSEGPLV